MPPPGPDIVFLQTTDQSTFSLEQNSATDYLTKVKYMAKAEKNCAVLKQELSFYLKSTLRFLIVQKMQENFYTSSEQLSDADYRNILEDWHKQATPAEEKILNEARFKTVSLFSWNSNLNATWKIKALMPILLGSGNNVIEIEADQQECYKLRCSMMPNGSSVDPEDGHAYLLLMNERTDLIYDPAEQNEVVLFCIKYNLPKMLSDFIESQQIEALPPSRFDPAFACQIPHLVRTYIDVLKTCKTLCSINFSAERISNEEMKSLIEVLKTNSTLKELNLSNKSVINDQYAQSLSEVLKHNSTLTTLNLSGTRITDKGAKAFHGVLLTNTTLTTLNLSLTRITGETAEDLYEALLTNSTLVSLSLSSTKVIARLGNSIKNKCAHNQLSSNKNNIKPAVQESH